MRGYFGIGVESISKAFNVGNLFRSAHAFGASFVFSVAAAYPRGEVGKTDTSDALAHLPYYDFPDVAALRLPDGCRLVGVELMDDSIELPSFTHPLNAAYVMGPERGSLSPELVDRCDHVIKIPTRFSLNVGIAGALVMYDRLLTRGRFAPRPVRAGGPVEALPEHRAGGPVFRSGPGGMERHRTPVPAAAVETANRMKDTD